MINLEHAHAVFDDYLKQFDCENDKIKLKIIHTDGVIDCAKEMSRRMGLSEEDRKLAELIALLHDIGRFEQARLYDSFEPSTMDHASFGVKMLFGMEKMIRKFVERDLWDEIIYQAIARHSDYAVGEGLSERELLHAKIIRDADKLDNCRVKIEDSIYVLLGCSEEEVGKQNISSEIWEECLKHVSIHSEKRKTKMDYWVSYIAYFFDINFPETCEMILEQNYVETIVKRIPYQNQDTKEKMEQLYQMVMEHLRRVASRESSSGFTNE